MRERDERREAHVDRARRAVAGRGEPNADPVRMGPGLPGSVLALQQLVGNAEVSRRRRTARCWSSTTPSSNQLLIYLHRWDVPQTSPLYIEVLRGCRAAASGTAQP